jgi:hypothetical protein
VRFQYFNEILLADFELKLVPIFEFPLNHFNFLNVLQKVQYSHIFLLSLSMLPSMIRSPNAFLYLFNLPTLTPHYIQLNIHLNHITIFLITLHCFLWLIISNPIDTCVPTWYTPFPLFLIITLNYLRIID